MSESVEAGQWEARPADITRPVLWSQVHLWPQVLCEQQSQCAKHTQSLPPDTDRKLCTQGCSHFTTTQNYNHSLRLLLIPGISVLFITEKVQKGEQLWEGRSSRSLNSSAGTDSISTENATLPYPSSHVTQLTAEEREHVILQHIFHLILIDLFLSKYEGKHISLKLHIKMYF